MTFDGGKDPDEAAWEAAVEKVEADMALARQQERWSGEDEEGRQYYRGYRDGVRYALSVLRRAHERGEDG